MDVSKILMHLQEKMEDISTEDMRGANTWGVHGYGGPNWETIQKIDVYAGLESFFESMKDGNKSALIIQENEFVEFCEWFLYQYDSEHKVVTKERHAQNKRFELLDLG
jgi:hypothetical protein